MNRRLKSVLEAHFKGEVTEESRARAGWLLREARAHRTRKLKVSLPRRKAAMARSITAREHRAEVYAAVDARASRCEAGFCESAGVEHDHFWGRGKSPETPESVWRLCRTCHLNKTKNYPSRVYWLRDFHTHCWRNEFHAQIEKIDRAIALELAQHPEG